jgi:hypothetical protein
VDKVAVEEVLFSPSNWIFPHLPFVIPQMPDSIPTLQRAQYVNTQPSLSLRTKENY